MIRTDHTPCFTEHIPRVATVREKYLENEIFSRSGKKSGNFVDGQGNLERIWKVRKKSGNLKINCYGRHRKFVYSVQEGKGLHFHEIV